MSDKLMELGSREKLKAITLEDNAFTDRRWLLGRNLNLQRLRYVNRYLCEQTTVNSEREKSGRIRGSCPARLPEFWLGCATPIGVLVLQPLSPRRSCAQFSENNCT